MKRFILIASIVFLLASCELEDMGTSTINPLIGAWECLVASSSSGDISAYERYEFTDTEVTYSLWTTPITYEGASKFYATYQYNDKEIVSDFGLFKLPQTVPYSIKGNELTMTFPETGITAVYNKLP